ncbi:MAG: HepT-like ribonuclease domain-containing protein [Acidimicrobiales bacterium]
MSPTRHSAWLSDITNAINAINGHLRRGDLDDGLVYDACRVRLIEIGEAVKHLDRDLLLTEPDIDWHAIAGMRDHLSHQYFDTEHSIVAHVLNSELAALQDAVTRLQARSVAAGSDAPAQTPGLRGPARGPVPGRKPLGRDHPPRHDGPSLCP